MTHCPSCENNGHKCNTETPCCNCVVKAMHEEEEAFNLLEKLLGIFWTEEIHAEIRKFLNHE